MVRNPWRSSSAARGASSCSLPTKTCLKDARADADRAGENGPPDSASSELRGDVEKVYAANVAGAENRCGGDADAVAQCDQPVNVRVVEVLEDGFHPLRLLPFGCESHGERMKMTIAGAGGDECQLLVRNLVGMFPLFQMVNSSFFLSPAGKQGPDRARIGRARSQDIGFRGCGNDRRSRSSLRASRRLRGAVRR